MLKCKNDPKRTYKGTEPSPKGLGYCAHNMKVDTIKKGKDGNKWIVKKVKNGSKRWVKIKDESLKRKKLNREIKEKKTLNSNLIQKNVNFDFNLKNAKINFIKELLLNYNKNEIKFLKKYINDKNFIIDINNKINEKDVNKILKKLTEKNVQNNIIKKIKNNLKKDKLNTFIDNKLLHYIKNINKNKCKNAILIYIQKQYNEMSIFGTDVTSILQNNFNVLTDTMVRDNIKMILQEINKETQDNKNSLITKTKPKIDKGKEINIKDNDGNQLYLHFNELQDVSILNKIKNTKLTQNKGKLIVRWFDYYTYKNYNSSISLKQALKISIQLIKNIIKNKNLNIESLNGSGLASIIKSNDIIFIEPQFT